MWAVLLRRRVAGDRKVKVKTWYVQVVEWVRGHARKNCIGSAQRTVATHPPPTVSRLREL